MEAIRAFFGSIDIWQVLSSFIFLIAIIDPFGNIPVTIAMEKKGVKINAINVCVASLIILMAFLFLGEWILKLFGVQIEYFAIAGGFVIMLLALEMLLDVTIFKTTDLGNESSDMIPLAFPMFAGPGSFTAMLSMHAKMSILSLFVSVVMCVVVLYIFLRGTDWLTQHLGPVSMYIVRKFFGIILLAMSVKMMSENLSKLF